MKTASEIRRTFLDYFQERGHRVVPSSPVFPQDDPTLLFTNAGMNQFKDVFLGTGKRDYTRAADTQKCIRVSGKHNDLEEVGVDTYHHTFFEMLGNWSFGDYFKKEAIEWAWDLLTRVYGLPKERLWVTVFGGDEADGLPADEEAETLWLEHTDIDPSRVLRFGKGDNFWEMGDTGPCGPCSEIHLDRGGEGSDPADGADPEIGVNAGNERFIELWNLVFMEFNRLDDGSLKSLPAKHVDTGMGFERIVSVLQGKRSNYDTDVFTPIFARIEELVGRKYGATQSEADIAFRVIADHVRAVSIAFADGALPSNLGRGYVLRRLIRRASRYGLQALGKEDPFIFEVVPAVIDTLGGVFPELGQRREHIQTLLRSEEESFAKTRGRGLGHFEELRLRVGPGGVLPGAEAFELYATHGFPKDLIELLCRENGLTLDQEGWTAAEKAHQEASRSDGKFTKVIGTNELTQLGKAAAGAETSVEEMSTYHDGGRDAEALETSLLALFHDPDRVVLRQSPFYPEAGGQIGDTGSIESLDGTFRFRVTDTQKAEGYVVHFGEAEGDAAPGTTVRAEVDVERRDRTRKNHTATHLLHKALKEVLGEHVNQQGSYVGPDRLRFDFSHPGAMTPEEIDEVERRVNDWIITNPEVTTTIEDLEAAKARGVVALFGEKYDDRVRVVAVGGASTELCGGTHVRAAGDIGPFVLVSEGAIQAGVRRVEALTGPAAVAWIQEQRRVLTSAARALKSSPDALVERIEQLQTQVKEAKRKASQSSKADVASAAATAEEGLREVEGVQVGLFELDLPQAALRDLATRLRGKHEDLAVVLIGSEGDRVPWIAVAQGGARERGFDARQVATFLRGHLGGGGGGKPELAQGQGQNAAGRAPARQAFEADPRAVFAG